MSLLIWSLHAVYYRVIEKITEKKKSNQQIHAYNYDMDFYKAFQYQKVGKCLGMKRLSRDPMIWNPWSK